MLEILAGTITPVFIIVGGILFTLYLRGFYVLHPAAFMKTLISGKGSLRGLNLALAGTLGVGNILGVVNAVRLGGAGAVFWMVLSSLLAAALKYAEAFLAVKTREGGRGGAYVYIEKAFRRIGRPLAVIYSVAFLGNGFATGCVMQSSAAVSALSRITGLPALFLSVTLAFAVFLSCFRGINGISKITNLLVPLMSAVYLTLSLLVIYLNRERLPDAVSAIFSGAFTREGAIFGVGGFAFTRAMRYGVMRGVLSNEAGTGSSATAHATEAGATPHKQGCMGVAEVLADTALMCTVTALALLTSGIRLDSDNDIESALLVFEKTGGGVFLLLAGVCVFIFGFASVICYSGYGTECLEYLFRGNAPRRSIILYIALYSFLVLVSPFIPGEGFLLASDTSMCIMTLLNIPAMYILSKKKALE